MRGPPQGTALPMEPLSVKRASPLPFPLPLALPYAPCSEGLGPDLGDVGVFERRDADGLQRVLHDGVHAAVSPENRRVLVGAVRPGPAAQQRFSDVLGASEPGANTAGNRRMRVAPYAVPQHEPAREAACAGHRFRVPARERAGHGSDHVYSGASCACATGHRQEAGKKLILGLP